MNIEQHAKTASRPLISLYKCPHCGKYVLQNVAISMSVPYNAHAAAVRSGSAERAQENADEFAAEVVRRLSDEQVDMRLLSRLRLKNSCHSCYGEPMWALMHRYDKLSKLSLLGFVALLVELLLLGDTAQAVMTVTTIISLAALCFPALYRALTLRKQKRMPPEYSPIFAENMDEMRIKAKKLRPDAEIPD